MATQQLIPDQPQNEFLTSISDYTKILGDLGNTAGSLYSSFIGAKATLIGAKTQSNQVSLQPVVSQLNAIEAQAKQKTALVYAGLALAALGAGVLIYKALK